MAARNRNRRVVGREAPRAPSAPSLANSPLFQQYRHGTPALRAAVAPPRPTAPAAPAAPAAGATPPAAPAQIIPDAQYLAGLAQKQFERTTAINALNSQTDDDKTTTAEAIRRLLQRVPDERRQISEGANRQGLFYSGQLGKRLGDYQAEVTRQEGDFTGDLGRREAAREAARKAIEAGAPLEQAAMLAAAADRQIGRDEDAAAAGTLVADVAPPVATTVKPAAKKKKRRSRVSGREVSR